jgi:hypothetical protein
MFYGLVEGHERVAFQPLNLQRIDFRTSPSFSLGSIQGLCETFSANSGTENELVVSRVHTGGNKIG